VTQTSILSVNCTNSSGLLGTHSDQRVCESLGVHCFSAVTVVVAAGPSGLYRWHPVPPRLVQAQIDAVTSLASPGAVKVGTLGTGALAEAVAQRLARRRLSPIVVGPALLPRSADHPSTQRIRRAVQAILASSVAAVLDARDAGAIVRPGLTMPPTDEAVQAMAELGPALVLIVEGDASGPLRFVLRKPADGLLTQWHLPPTQIDARAVCEAVSAAMTARLALGDSPDQALASALCLMGCEPAGDNSDNSRLVRAFLTANSVQQGLAVRTPTTARAGDE